MRTTIVIPTYNERENIARLLEAIGRLPAPNLSILVVDDSSPDGTGEIVRAISDRDAFVRLLSRPVKQGLGRAYTAAFSSLLGPSGGSTGRPDPVPQPDIIVQMDADFSHQPVDLPRLLAALEHADLVIGSRYVPGGCTENWALPRRVLSRGANQYARLVTGVAIHDFTGGFNAWRAGTLAAVHPETIHAEGYGYLIELKVRAARQGARIAEIPITFIERRVGQSKLDRQVIWEAAGVVIRLGWKR